MNILMVGAGGFVGAVMRYLLTQLFPQAAGLPFTTLTINGVGSFVIGCLWGISSTMPVSPYLLLLLQVGICGGFTTFSTFSLETVKLMEAGKLGIALLYILLSVLICLLATWLGRTGVISFLSAK